MADGNLLATYLKKGVDYEFDIKFNIWDIANSKMCGSYRNSLLNKFVFCWSFSDFLFGLPERNLKGKTDFF
jgi:hypothetical protein